MSSNNLAPDWTLLEIEGVVSTVEAVATKVAEEFNFLVDRDDLIQEGYLTTVTKADLRQTLLDGEMGLYAHGLRMDLVNVVNAEVRRVDPLTSFEEAVERELARESL